MSERRSRRSGTIRGYIAPVAECRNVREVLLVDLNMYVEMNGCTTHSDNSKVSIEYVGVYALLRRCGVSGNLSLRTPCLCRQVGTT